MSFWQQIVAGCSCVCIAGGFVMLLSLGEIIWRGFDWLRDRRAARRPVCTYRAMRPEDILPVLKRPRAPGMLPDAG